MSNKGGYLLLENIISLSIVLTISLVLYSLLILCINSKNSIEDKIEVQQQGLEISKSIKSLIEKSKGIIDIEFDNIDNINEDGIYFKSAISVKCRYSNENDINYYNNKNKEISFKKGLNKLFINTLNSNNQSEVGGYEIGDYVEKIYVSNDESNKFINIKLKLKKNKEIYETKFKVYIRNFEGEFM